MTIFLLLSPSLGLLTVNALCAADCVIVPLQCEFYALEGLSQLMRTIEMVQRGLNRNLVVQGIVLTMFDTATNYLRWLQMTCARILETLSIWQFLEMFYFGSAIFWPTCVDV